MIHETESGHHIEVVRRESAVILEVTGLTKPKTIRASIHLSPVQASMLGINIVDKSSDARDYGLGRPLPERDPEPAPAEPSISIERID